MKIDRPTRWVIFAGIPAAAVALLFVVFESNGGFERVVGQKALPYALFFAPVAIVILGKVLYDRFPKALVVPLGIAGWVLHAALPCWFFWFGPGALKFH